MAGKLIAHSDIILGAVTQFWRELPDAIGTDGPFVLLYTDIESEAVPAKDQGNKPWGRLTLSVTNGKATNIAATKFKVEGVLTLQIFVNGKRTSNTEIAKKTALFIQDKISGFKNSPIVMVDVNAVTGLKQDGYYAAGVRGDLYWYERRTKTTLADDTSEGEVSKPIEFTQSTPSLVWIVNHNLGYRPSVETLTVGGAEMEAEVIHTSNMQFRVMFDTPTAGFAIYR